MVVGDHRPNAELNLIDKFRHVFRQYRPPDAVDADTDDPNNRTFNIPKLHAMIHYPDFIRQFGSAQNLDSSYGEAAHIRHLKEPYTRTNKNDCFEGSEVHRTTMVNDLTTIGVRLIFTTAWHPSADGMSERTNQTIEIALRYLLATLDDHRQWPVVLARLSVTLNNSAIGLAATQVMYGRRIKEALDLIRAEADSPILPLDDEPMPAPRTRAGSAPAPPAVMVARQ
ncbi:MAG: hypothetical protein Q9196_002655 [Gyalolechia fulgens]